MIRLKNTDEKKWYKVEFYTTTPEEVSESVHADFDTEVAEFTVRVDNPEKQEDDWEKEFDRLFHVDRKSGVFKIKDFSKSLGFTEWRDTTDMSYIKQFIRQLEKQTKLDTARRIAEVAQEAGLVPKDLASATDWKEAVEIIKKQTRESVIEEIRRWTKGKDVTKDKLRNHLNQLKQKIKE